MHERTDRDQPGASDEMDQRARIALLRRAQELAAQGDTRAVADLLAALNAASRRDDLVTW